MNDCFFILFLSRKEIKVMLKDFGIFIALVCLLVSIVFVLNARWVIKSIDNNYDLENNMVGRIKVIASVVSMISLFCLYLLIR
jgi:uncharacterized membrane protein YidH (DUF202 family)